MRSRPPAATDDAAPLSAAEFAARLDVLGPFEERPQLAVAVSGGPDSSALALLADGWARARGGSVLALIVDHGLRARSASEAAGTAWRLAAARIRSRILVWAGDKPLTGVQVGAREARYRLLGTACREEGILHLLLGHQREDQAETVAMRAASASGSRGLAGMAAVSEVPGLRRLRPLLSVPKARLTATLRATGGAWLVDPSNLSAAFARGRLRLDPVFEVQQHWYASRIHATSRAALDAVLAHWLALHVHPHPLGWLGVDRAAFADLAADRRQLLLAQILATVGGAVYPAGRRLASGVANRMLAAAVGERCSAGGCIVSLRTRHLIVSREPGRVQAAVVLEPGGEHDWDGRYHVVYHSGTDPLRLAPLAVGHLPADLRRRLRDVRVPALALACLPALWAAGRLVACPPLEPYGCRTWPGVHAMAALRPALPLAPAAFEGVNVV